MFNTVKYVLCSIAKMTTPATIKKKISEGKHHLIDIREMSQSYKRNFQSPVWNSFLAILDENNEVISQYVVCKNCKEIFKCTVLPNRNDIGTSSLLRHDKVCKSKLQTVSKKKNRE